MVILHSNAQINNFFECQTGTKSRKNALRLIENTNIL